MVATVNIEIPRALMQNIQQFMANVQRMNNSATQFRNAARQQQQQRQPPMTRFQILPSFLYSRFNALNQALSRIDTGLVSIIGRLYSSLGFIATRFLRVVTTTVEILTPIVGWTVAGIETAVSLTVLGAKFAKSLWYRIVDLGGVILQDYLQASGTFSTVGGLRAFRSTFGAFLDDPGMLQNFVQARGAQSTKQFAALKALGVHASSDTTEMMVEATVLAAQYMKKQDQGTSLIMANAIGLTSLFEPKTLILLRGMTTQEIQELQGLYKAYKPLMEISTKARVAWVQFDLQVKAMGAQIISVIGEKLADPNSPIVQAIKKLSDSLVNFFRVFMKTPFMESLVKTIGDYADQFATWLEQVDVDSMSKKIMKISKRILKYFKIIIEALNDVLTLFGGAIITPARAEPAPKDAAAQEITTTISAGGFSLYGRHRMRPGGGGEGGRGGGAGASSVVRRPGGKRADPRELEAYIRERAIAYGVDPDIAVRVARSEGLNNPNGDYVNGRPTSFGAFQLHVTSGGGAVGDQFYRDTGLDPSDPRNERATIDYGLWHASRYGWGAWSGAKRQGIYGFTGVNRGGTPKYPGYKGDAAAPLERKSTPDTPAAATDPNTPQDPNAPKAPGKSPITQQPGTEKFSETAFGEDPRLRDIIRETSRYLPKGWKAQIESGYRPGDPRFHGKHMASDVAIYDASGRKLSWYQSPHNYAIYQAFAQKARAVQVSKFPELNHAFRWGGYFKGPLGPGGTYGAMDLMHFDLGGNVYGMVAGSWEHGVSKEWAQKWGLSYYGLPPDPMPNQPQDQPQPLVAQPAAQPAAQPQPKPVAQNDNKNPVQNVKVDNRSDMEVCTAKTNSFEDIGSLDSMATSYQ